MLGDFNETDGIAEAWNIRDNDTRSKAWRAVRKMKPVSVMKQNARALRSSHQDKYSDSEPWKAAEKNVMPAAGDLMAAVRNTTSSWKTERVKPLPETLALQKGDTSHALRSAAHRQP